MQVGGGVVGSQLPLEETVTVVWVGGYSMPRASTVKVTFFVPLVEYWKLRDLHLSNNDGTHVFSRTYREHVLAVNKYQRGGSN